MQLWQLWIHLLDIDDCANLRIVMAVQSQHLTSELNTRNTYYYLLVKKISYVEENSYSPNILHIKKN